MRNFLSSDTLQGRGRRGRVGRARTKTVWIGIQRRTHLDEEDDDDDEFRTIVKFCSYLALWIKID